MTKRSSNGFAADFRRFFARGLATLLPTVLTIVLLVKCFEFVQQHISVHLTNSVAYVVVRATDYPELTEEQKQSFLAEQALPEEKAEDPEVMLRARLALLSGQWNQGPRSLAGFALAIALVYVLGRLLASFLGRKLWQLFESAVGRLPLFKQVYPYVKQVTDYLFGEKKIEFSRVVAVPYPRKDVYSIGLVTGAGFRHVSERTQQQYLTVFIPSSPTPVTGYVVYIKKEEVIDLPITLEEAFRFTVSGGVIVPDAQALPTQLQALAAAHGKVQLGAEEGNASHNADGS